MDMNLIQKLIDDEWTELKRQVEVGDYIFSIEENGLKLVQHQTGLEAGYPHIAQVDTHLYIYKDHYYAIKVDVDSNKVLENKHIDFVQR